jgi:hypothetical protein
VPHLFIWVLKEAGRVIYTVASFLALKAGNSQITAYSRYINDFRQKSSNFADTLLIYCGWYLEIFWIIAL